jgi:hypothetical protein
VHRPGVPWSNEGGRGVHLRGPTELNICLRVSMYGSSELSGLCGHFCAWVAPWGLLWALLVCRGSNEGECVGCALGTSTGLQHSIITGEGQGLDHWNRLLKARMPATGNILKALKMGFCDFLLYIWTPKSDKK